MYSSLSNNLFNVIDPFPLFIVFFYYCAIEFLVFTNLANTVVVTDAENYYVCTSNCFTRTCNFYSLKTTVREDSIKEMRWPVWGVHCTSWLWNSIKTKEDSFAFRKSFFVALMGRRCVNLPKKLFFHPSCFMQSNVSVGNTVYFVSVL